jgi:hypothetical protein
MYLLKIVVKEQNIEMPDEESFKKETELFEKIKKAGIENLFAKCVHYNPKDLSIWFERGDASLSALSKERAKKNDLWSEEELLN